MTEEKYSTIEVDVDDKIKCDLIKRFIEGNFSGASNSLFEELLTDVDEDDFDATLKAASDALLNEAIVDAINEMVVPGGALLNEVPAVDTINKMIANNPEEENDNDKD